MRRVHAIVRKRKSRPNRQKSLLQMQTTRTHQLMVRQEKANPRERQSNPCTGNILSIRLKRSCTRESQHQIGRRNRRTLRPPQKWDRGRKREIHRPRTGFLKGPKLAALVRVLRLRKMYISRFNSVTMPFIYFQRQGGRTRVGRQWSDGQLYRLQNGRKAPVGDSKTQQHSNGQKHRWDLEPFWKHHPFVGGKTLISSGFSMGSVLEKSCR